MKKITVLFLCFALLLSSFASCQRRTGGESASERDTVQSTETQSEERASKTEDALNSESKTEKTEDTAANENSEATAEQEADTEAMTTEKPSGEASEESSAEASEESSAEASEESSAKTSEESSAEASETESEVLSSQESTREAESEPLFEEPTEESGASEDASFASALETESETASEEIEELPIKSLDEELAALGISGYDYYKLMLVSLYYELYYIGDTMPNARQIARSVRALFDEYFADIDKSDKESMTTAVILCYQYAVGDQYATYFDEESYAEQQRDQDAEFVGIGVYISYSPKDGSAQVLSVFEGTPAAEAGILPGDYLLSVDGVSIEEIGYYELANRIRGEEDSYVTVGVSRNGEQLFFTMQRKKVQGVSVSYRCLAQDENIGYVKIEQFDSKTPEQFKKAIDELVSCGVEGFIFDLRGNPGGEVSAVVSVLDYLMADGKMIARFRYNENLSGGNDTVYIAQDGHELTLPMTVLCDSYTASAGELFTAALRDHEMATVIGVTTYGKGTAQMLVDLQDGTAFTLSAARYDPPSGENYEGIGVIPHIKVELSEEAASVNSFLRDDLIDNQLQTAVTEINRLRKEALQ